MILQLAANTREKKRERETLNLRKRENGERDELNGKRMKEAFVQLKGKRSSSRETSTEE